MERTPLPYFKKVKHLFDAREHSDLLSSSDVDVPHAPRPKEKVAPKLKAWKERLISEGRAVPASPKDPSQPDYRGIALELRVNAQVLNAINGKHRKVILTAVRQLGLATPVPRIRREPEPVQPKLDAWADHLRRVDGRVPMSYAHPDRPDYVKIARDIDVDSWVLISKKAPYNAFIDALVAERGLSRVSPLKPNRLMTLSELLAAIRRDRDFDNSQSATPKTPEQMRAAEANTQWAVTGLVGPYAETLGAEAAPVIRAAIEALSNTSESKRLARELRSCLAFLEALPADGYPVSLPGALDFALRRSGLPLTALAREIGMNEITLRDWATGKRVPGNRSAAKLSRIEAFLEIPTGILQERVRSSSRVPVTPTEKGNANRRTSPPRAKGKGGKGGKRGAARGSGSVFPRDWPLDRDALGAPIYVRPTLWPAQLRGERDSFMIFRSDPIQPLGLARSGELWTRGTQAMRDAEFGRLFSHIRRRHQEFAAAPELLSFALLINPRFLHDFKTERVNDRNVRTNSNRVTSVDLGTMRSIRAMFESHTGWVTQNAWLADRLVAVEGARPGEWIISPDDVAKAQADWRGMCRVAFEEYDRMCKGARKSVRTKNVHGAYEAILRLKDSLLAFRLGAQGLTAEIKQLQRSSHAYCIAVRDKVLWGIQSQCAFRIANTKLSFHDGADSQFRLENGQFVINIKREEFKNKNGPYFCQNGVFRNYHRALEDHADLYNDIQEYLTYCRPMLLRGNDSDQLFISHVDAGDLGVAGLGFSIQRTYNRYVRWDPIGKTGIEGARETGPHFARAVLATGIYKLTHDYQIAADAIHDSVETAQGFYVENTPEDRSDRMRTALQKGLAA